MKAIINFYLILVIIPIGGCVGSHTRIYHDQNSEAGRLITQLDILKKHQYLVENKGLYIDAAHKFVEFSVESNETGMINLTSTITISKIGMEKLRAHYKNNVIAKFSGCKILWEVNDIEYFVDELGNGGAEVFGSKVCREDKVRFGVSVLKENNSYMVGLIRPAS